MVEYEDEAEDPDYDEYEDAEEAEVTQHRPPAGERRFFMEKLTLAVLVGVSVGGVAIADFSTRYGFQYWLAVVPLFALASLFVSWKRARADGLSAFRIFVWQVLHWSPLLLAIYLVFFLQQTGRLNREDAGLVALILLSLTTLSAGVHFDWRLFVVGLMLGVTTACVAFVEEFVWILLIGAAMTVAVLYFWPRRKR